MITTLKHIKISGVLAVLPENEYLYDEETKPFATPATRRLKRMMGFDKRRAAKADTTSCDFCLYGMRYLLDNGLLRNEESGAIVVLGVTPDYYMPQMSNILQGELGLPYDVVCMDISQACAAYVLGTYQAGMILEHLPAGKKVVVCTSDVLCRKDPSWPLQEPSFGGDAATITIYERNLSASDIHINVYNDGSRREALIIHAGGFKMPCTPETAVPHDIGDGKMRSYNDLWMDGSAVFNFVQREVPPMIKEILEYSGKTKEEIDWYLFHQPNKFMVEKLAQRLGIPIAYNLGEKLLDHTYTCCLSGFGGGLAWASAVLELGHLDFCRMIVSDL